MQPTSSMEWVNLVMLAPGDVGVQGRATSIFRWPCTDLCASLVSDPAQQFVCQYACEEIEAQAGEPCIQAFANSTDEHLALLSYSSGHYVETARIAASAALQHTENLEFVQRLHLNDRGSPTGCHAIEDAHYCFLRASAAVSLGLCLPEACDSASIMRILRNISPTPPAGLDYVAVVCGDEFRLDIDRGAILVLVLVACLAALTFAGTLLDNQKKLHAEQCTQNRSAIGGAGPHQAAHSQSTSNCQGRLAASSTPGGQADTKGHKEQHHEENALDLDAGVGIVGKVNHDFGCEENDPVHAASLVEGNGSSANEDGGVLRLSEQSVREPLLGTTSPSRGSSLLRQRSLVRWSTWKGSPSRWVQFLKCFSLRKNMRKLLAPPRSSNNFGALDGIRTLSNIWIILFHTMFIQLQAGGGISNMIDVLPIDGHGVLSRFSAQFILGALFAVDTFFFMSGFLASVSLLPSLESESRSTSQGLASWVLERYWRRYIRLMPTTVFVMLLTWQVFPLGPDGPTWWSSMKAVRDVCRKYWWTEILFVQNFVPWPPLGTCLPVAWSLGAELQFFLVAVPLLVLYRYRPRASVVTLVSIAVASCLYTLWFGFYKDLRFAFFHSVISDPSYNAVYYNPWARCPTYIIGLLSGMAWHAYVRGGEGVHRGLGGPAADASLVARDQGVFVVVCSVTSALLMFLPVYGAYWANRDMQEVGIPAWADHLYLAFSRPCWTLGVALLCGLCFFGRGGVVNKVLTLPVWTPLSQLTFCCYLIHCQLIFGLYGSRGIPFRYTSFEFAITFVGAMVVSFAVAAAIHLIVEAPFRNLDSLVGPRCGRRSLER